MDQGLIVIMSFVAVLLWRNRGWRQRTYLKSLRAAYISAHGADRLLHPLTAAQENIRNQLSSSTKSPTKQYIGTTARLVGRVDGAWPGGTVSCLLNKPGEEVQTAKFTVGIKQAERLKMGQRIKVEGKLADYKLASDLLFIELVNAKLV
jgi:hypothetical protein